MSSYEHTVIIIVGPTASGKTELALTLARRFHSAIISADSRQCFRELDIGVAKPAANELSTVKHYFINSHSIHEPVTAQVFEAYALEAAAEIFKQSRIAIMAGGTGLYINAFCEGFDNMPEINTEIRRQVTDNYKQHGLEWLQQQVQWTDPEFWGIAEQQNPHRLMRALEVKLATGISIANYRRGTKKERPFNIVKLGLDIPRAQLYHNINTRTDAMINNGLLAEVISLQAYRRLNALQTVGYKEIFDYLDAKVSLDEAIEKIKKHTRHYAKRQLTWFKKDSAVNWADADTILSNIDDYLSF